MSCNSCTAFPGSQDTPFMADPGCGVESNTPTISVEPERNAPASMSAPYNGQPITPYDMKRGVISRLEPSYNLQRTVSRFPFNPQEHSQITQENVDDALDNDALESNNTFELQKVAVIITVIVALYMLYRSRK